MKYSQPLGILATLMMIGLCFLPWTFIQSIQLSVTGFHAPGTNYGKPGMLNLILGVVLLILFAIPAIWAKRTNVLIAGLNLAWSARNYLLLSSCMMGECPEKKPALFGLVIFALFIQVMALLPGISVSPAKK